MILPRIRNAKRNARQTIDDEHVFQMVRAICHILSLPVARLEYGYRKGYRGRVAGTMVLMGKGTGTSPQCCCTTVEAPNCVSTLQETIVDPERLCTVPTVKDKYKDYG
jgi:hypothetical protein